MDLTADLVDELTYDASTNLLGPPPPSRTEPKAKPKPKAKSKSGPKKQNEVLV